MADEIFMDVPAVRDMSKKFGDMGDNLKTVSQTLENMMNILKASAFIGNFGGAALASYMENIKPSIDQFAESCTTMADDLTSSADAYERGDAAGATKFH